MGGKSLAISADGGQFALGEAEGGRQDPGLAYIGLHARCGRRLTVVEHRPVGAGGNGRKREGLVEGEVDYFLDYAQRRDGYGDGEEGEEVCKGDWAWSVHGGWATKENTKASCTEGKSLIEEEIWRRLEDIELAEVEESTEFYNLFSLSRYNHGYLPAIPRN